MSYLLQAIDRFDRNLFLSLNQSQKKRICQVLNWITSFGGLQFQTFLTLSLLLFSGASKLGLKLAIVQSVVTLVVQIIKAKVARVRPYDAIQGIKPVKTERDFSFPSGHTAAAFATALVMTSAIQGIGIICLALAALVGYSRVYLGVHYPSDVLAGFILGSGFTVAILSVLPF